MWIALFVLLILCSITGLGWMLSRADREEAEQRIESLNEQIGELEQTVSGELARMEALRAGLGMGVTPITREFRVIPAFQKLSERDGEPISPCFKSLWNRTEVCPECPVEEAFETGELAVSEHRVELESGEEQFFRVIAAPVLAADGKSDHVLELVQDITERRRLETQLLRAAKLAALGELASSIAHEINNPLTSISAYAEQLSEAAKKPDLAERDSFKKFPKHLATIRKNVKRCKDITMGLLNFTRGVDAPPAKVDIARALADTLSLVEPEARQRAIVVETEIDEGLHPVLGQKGELQQVMLNLLTNALDASPEGGTVSIRARQEGGEVCLEFEDRGEGIPQEHRSDLFSPFFTTKSTGLGTGLGLAICSRIVKQLNGSITFDSSPERGTLFTVRLASSASPVTRNEAA